MVTPRATPDGSNAAPKVMISSAINPHGHVSIARRPPRAGVLVGAGPRSPPGSYAALPRGSGGSGGRVLRDLLLDLLLGQRGGVVHEGNHPSQDDVIRLRLEIVEEIGRASCRE